MKLSLDLAPMQTVSLTCPGCGQILGKRAEQATDRELTMVDCLALGDPPTTRTSRCTKCGQLIVERTEG